MSFIPMMVYGVAYFWLDRSHLKLALSLATKSQDNHFRALVLAFIASQYMYTAGEHAYSMLQAIDQMGAGLGATSGKVEDGKDKSSVGNAPLRLWVGERLLGEFFFGPRKFSGLVGAEAFLLIMGMF